MKKADIIMSATALFAAPAQAANWHEARPGTFVGARLTIGGRTGVRPSAALTIAPTQNRMFYDGSTSMKIGEGIALNFTAGTKPTLTLAGLRADRALGLQQTRSSSSEEQLGVSKGGKIAIGMAVVAVAAVGGTYLYLSSRCTECDQ